MSLIGQSINSFTKGPSEFAFPPSMNVSDVTVSTMQTASFSSTGSSINSGDFQINCRWFQAKVFLKGYSPGQGSVTGNERFVLEAAPAASFPFALAGGRRVIASAPIDGTVTLNSLYLIGNTGDTAMECARVRFIGAAGAAVTYDAIIDGTP